MKPNHSLRHFFALAGAAAVLTIHSINAATIYWDGTSATWNDVANWSTVVGATTPDPGALPLSTDDLIFNITGANTAQNITLDANQVARTLTFNTTGATNFRGNSSGTTARTLTIGAGGITLAAGAGNVTIGESPLTYGAVNIFKSGAQTWKSSAALLSIAGNVNLSTTALTIGDTSNNGTVNISGVISGSGAINAAGSGNRLELSGLNDFTSNLNIAGGSGIATVAVTSVSDYGFASAIGASASGSITFGAGTNTRGRLEYIGTVNGSSNRTITISGSGGGGAAAAQILNNGAGTLTFTAATFVNSANRLLLGGSNTGSNEISGIIAGNMAILKNDAGTWVLGGGTTGNSYTGTTTVNGGILVFANKAAKAAGTVTAVAAGSVGLGVKASDAAYFSETDVAALFNTSLTGFTMNAASGVAIDTTNAGGSFDQTVALTTSTRSLTKLGTGTLVLSNTNTYTGATTVNAGSLIVNGSISTSIATVQSGATLGGTGTVGAVNVSGQLSPGASIETLATGDLSLLNGSTLVHELDSFVSDNVGSDLLKVAGNLSLAGTVNLTLTDLALVDSAFAVNDVFSLINYTGTWNNGLFTFGGNELADEEVFSFGLNNWKISYDDPTGGLNYAGEYAGGADSFVNLTAVAIPEPRAALLGGLGMLILLRRRRN